MAMILHCDGCQARHDSLDGNRQLPPQGAPVATNEAPARISVSREIQIFDRKFDLCNRCIAKINTVLERPIDSAVHPPSSSTKGGLTTEYGK